MVETKKKQQTATGDVDQNVQDTAVTPDESQRGEQQPAGPAQMDQPTLCGMLVREALLNPASMPQVKRNLIIWYNAQPLENRKDMARVALKTMDQLKLVAESLYQTFVEISMADRSQLV